MAFNFAELQQAYLRNLETIDNIIEMLRKLPGTGYQQVEYYDRNGNLVTKNIPNIGQLINQFQQGVNSVMAKTVYVDAENGSDETGDGSSSAPFKTLQKAINSVPSGGIVNIILLSDYINGNEKIYLANKVVRIWGYYEENGHGYRHKLLFPIAPRGNNNTVYGFSGGGTVLLYYCDIGFVDNRDPNKPFDAFAQIFDFVDYYSLGWKIFLSRCKVTLTDYQDVAFVHSHGAGIGTAMVNVYSTEINSTGNDSYFARITNSTLILNTYNANLTGTKTSWSNLIRGIVKDSNGIPRNVVSNIVL